MSTPIGQFTGWCTAAHNRRVAELAPVRRRNLRRVIDAEPYVGNATAFANAIQMSPPQLANTLTGSGGKSFGEKLARKIERAAKLPPMYLDTEDAPPPPRPATPVLPHRSSEAARFAAEWDQLDEPARTQIQIMVEALRANQIKAEREAKKRREVRTGAQPPSSA